MRKKRLLLLMLSAIALVSMAQQPPISHLEINNVFPTILGDGTCFVPQKQLHYGDELGDTYYNCTSWEVPAGSGKQTIFQHALWFGGLDASEELHLAAYRFGQVGQDYWSGPLRTSDGSVDRLTSMKYHHIWNLTRAEIDQFIANHGNANYQVPEDILTWPAHGDAGYAQNLAPFVDVNGDGHYNPADGDYPDIKGDQCLFFIFNDYRPHTESSGAVLNLEVHAMVYAFNAPNDEALNNTVFVNYKCFNRSANDYHNTYLGLWTDWDIGYSADDYVGCDVQRNSCFAYNGTPVDGEEQPWVYGDNPPVQVLSILKGPDGLGMTGFMSHNNSSADNGDPHNAAEYYLYLQGRWLNGQHMLYGSNAYGCHYTIWEGEEPIEINADPVGPECNYMFPGDSDPDNIGTGGIAPNGGYNTNGKFWTEEECVESYPSPSPDDWYPFGPGDRRGLAIVGPFSFGAGSMKELDYAMITVWKNNSQTAMERKGEFIDHVKALFNNGFAK